jgi:hypothetical protein
MPNLTPDYHMIVIYKTISGVVSCIINVEHYCKHGAFQQNMSI